jgi:transposase
MRIRKRYTQEFKEEAVKLVLEEGYSQTETAKRLGICFPNLNRWIKELRGNGEDKLSKPKQSAEQEELAHLRKENKRLKLEREILKKAAAFFANESNSGMNL